MQGADNKMNKPKIYICPKCNHQFILFTPKQKIVLECISKMKQPSRIKEVEIKLHKEGYCIANPNLITILNNLEVGGYITTEHKLNSRLIYFRRK